MLASVCYTDNLCGIMRIYKQAGNRFNEYWVARLDCFRWWVLWCCWSCVANPWRLWNDGWQERDTTQMTARTKKAVNSLAYSSDVTSTSFQSLVIGMSYVFSNCTSNRIQFVWNGKCHGCFGACYRILFIDIQECYQPIALDIRRKMTCWSRAKPVRNGGKV